MNTIRFAPVIIALVLQSAMAAGQAGQARPERIVSLIPAVTEMLFAIEAGGQLAGVSSFDTYPPEVRALERVGALLDPDLEKIFSLRPDLVVVYGTQTDLRRQLDRARIPQFVYKHGGLREVTDTLRALGERVGRRREAEAKASQIEQALAGIRRRVAGRPRPRTLVVIAREAGSLRGIYASGGTGFVHDMLEAAGGINVFGDLDRESIQVSTELILARRPDVILELRGTPVTDDERRREEGVWQAISAVPAVRGGRVHLIGDERTVVPGPRVAEGTELLARALHAGSAGGR